MEVPPVLHLEEELVLGFDLGLVLVLGLVCLLLRDAFLLFCVVKH